MGADDGVAVAEMAHHTGRHCLLADAEVELAVDLATAGTLEAGLLEGAHDEHRPVPTERASAVLGHRGALPSSSSKKEPAGSR